jgi:threonine dehydratase
MFSDLRATEVLAAAHRLRGLVERTPLVHSPELSQLAGGDVYLKLENKRTTGSFKLRGALNSVATLPEEVRRRGIVASSAGNHGLGIAYAAKRFGIPARIFVPATAPKVKRDGIASLGAHVDESQPHYDAAHAAALKFAATHDATFVNPCAGAVLLAGQGTVALEIIEDLPDLATFVVPVGGGGLLGGCASLLRRVSPDARIIGAQSVATDAMARSLEAGRVVEIGYPPTLADGLAGQIDDEGFEIGVHALDAIETVSEDDIARAIVWLGAHGMGRVEGAGAVGVAAVLARRLTTLASPVAIVVSGGNIDEARLAELGARFT